ncbi:hypothetical protein HDU93_009455 [Gonapodya sp. JEL0774]|nr:hypothetical protein HDU93_009455 [Gonapodya sp. JEL0774]
MTETSKTLFRVEAIPESAPQLPSDIQEPSSNREEYRPKTRTGMLAYKKIEKGYKAFAGGGDLTDLWESYADGSVTYFAGNMKNLNRYPRPSKEFWAVFFTLAKYGLKEIVSNSIIDLLVWDNGYAFATFNNSYTTYSGTTWTGNSLNRMKYDDKGQIYDQAFYYEDLRGIDKITEELFELQEVKDELWEMFGRRF